MQAQAGQTIANQIGYRLGSSGNYDPSAPATGPQSGQQQDPGFPTGFGSAIANAGLGGGSQSQQQQQPGGSSPPPKSGWELGAEARNRAITLENGGWYDPISGLGQQPDGTNLFAGGSMSAGRGATLGGGGGTTLGALSGPSNVGNCSNGTNLTPYLIALAAIDAVLVAAVVTALLVWLVGRKGSAKKRRTGTNDGEKRYLREEED